jgi:hypothetical protein
MSGIAPRIRFINEISVKKPIDHVMEKHSELIFKENLKQRRNLSDHQPDSSGQSAVFPLLILNAKSIERDLSD